jgi:hypothetical protein
MVGSTGRFVVGVSGRVDLAGQFGQSLVKRRYQAS